MPTIGKALSRLSRSLPPPPFRAPPLSAFISWQHRRRPAFRPPISQFSLSHTTTAVPSSALPAAAAFLAAVSLPVALSADELPVTGACGIGKAKGQASSSPRPPLVWAQEERAGGRLAQAGEDALFVASNGCAWGVADGVGGWAEHPGADSAAYSRTLMRYALAAANALPLSVAASSSSSPSQSASTSPSQLPLSILESAYSSTQHHGIIGSSTACIVTYDPHSQQVHYANLGDSGLLIIRSAALSSPSAPSSSSPLSSARYEKSSEKQHSFNCPYQLGHASGDRPHDADLLSLSVAGDDLLLLGTDGYFDNVAVEETVGLCRRYLQSVDAAAAASCSSPPAASSPTASMDELARLLCEEAHAAARSATRDTPFSRYCRRHGRRYAGGKMDDISVIAVRFRHKQPTVRDASNDAANNKAANGAARSRL